MITIAGLDPGTHRTGYAVIHILPQGDLKLLDVGVWELSPKKEALGLRLETLYREARDFFKRYNPQVIGLEKAIYFKNVSSSLKLSEARGVLRLAAHHILESAEERFWELSPTAVKKISSGSGAQSKKNLQHILKLRFQNGVSELLATHTLDASDALAVAYTAWTLVKTKFFVQPRV